MFYLLSSSDVAYLDCVGIYKYLILQLLGKLSAKMFYLHFDQWNDSLLRGHMLGHMIKLLYPIGSGGKTSII